MWYDATSAAGLAGGQGLPGRRQDRLRARAGREDQELRLALHLGLGRPEGEQEPGRRLEVHLLGLRQGLREPGRQAARLVPGPRRQARVDLRQPRVRRRRLGASPQPPRTRSTAADPTNPGVQPRPAPGIQFVDIPEFTDLGTQVSQQISAAIAGQTSVADALEAGQQLAAEAVADKYKGTSDMTAAAPRPTAPAGVRMHRRPAPPPGRAAPGPAGRRCCPPWCSSIVVTQLPFVATLVISFMRLERARPDRPRLRRTRQLHAVASPTPTLRSSVVTTVILTVAVVLVSLLLGTRPRPAAGPPFPGPRLRAHAC